MTLPPFEEPRPRLTVSVGYADSPGALEETSIPRALPRTNIFGIFLTFYKSLENGWPWACWKDIGAMVFSSPSPLSFGRTNQGANSGIQLKAPSVSFCVYNGFFQNISSLRVKV